MDIEANDLLIFAQVVELGSFSKAADKLHLPKSTLSRRLSMLEQQLGERLLQRSTRRLTLTDLGHAVLLHAQQVQQEVRATVELSLHRQAQPSGKLRVSMPPDFANQQMSEMLAKFMSAYPQIELELDLSPRRVDILGENFDLALRVGELDDDATLAARSLANFSVGLYAAPAYLTQHGHPSEPEALMEHQCLAILSRTGAIRPWRMEQGAASWQGIPPIRSQANSPELLVRLALQGAGIIRMPDHFAYHLTLQGRLVRILNDWQCPNTTLWAVFPGRRLMPSRTRVFLDALQAEFANPLCQRLGLPENFMKEKRALLKTT